MCVCVCVCVCVCIVDYLFNKWSLLYQWVHNNTATSVW